MKLFHFKQDEQYLNGYRPLLFAKNIARNIGKSPCKYVKRKP